MEATRLNECMRALGWGRGRMMMVFGYGESTVRDWVNGSLPIPEDVARFLEARLRRERMRRDEALS
jgi:hypothetical protein